jgi:hypothetical protein
MKILDNLRYHDEEYGRDFIMRWDQLYMALGLDPKKHLPVEGVPAKLIGNVPVWVEPKVQGMSQDGKRVWCMCPYCEKSLTAGKLQQHLKVHR